MTIQVAVVGIDGSGKSTIVGALPRLLAAENHVTVGAIGDEVQLVAPDADRILGSFAPEGVPLAARLALLFKRGAKALVAWLTLYPIAKILHLALQDHAARALARRNAAVVVTDGNLLLSALGRAANYRMPASVHEGATERLPGAGEFAAILDYVVTGSATPSLLVAFPFLRRARLLLWTLRALGLRAGRLPDVVIFLDASPERALARLSARGRVDRHENTRDLAQASAGYVRALEGARAFAPGLRIVRVDVDRCTAAEALDAVLGALRKAAPARPSEAREPAQHLAPASAVGPAAAGHLLGTPRLEGARVVRQLLSARYVFRSFLPHLFEGAWREPLFFLSRDGRTLLRDGYSAAVMHAIYIADRRRASLAERAFYGYALHRAVRNRLDVLVDRLYDEIVRRLDETSGEVRVFTAPSGLADDVFGALERLNARAGDLGRVRIVAADLDLGGTLAPALEARARRLGVRLTFVRADLTDAAARGALAAHAPFDLLLFVGLSAWIPKPAARAHLSFLRACAAPQATLLVDVFTPGPFALSGHCAGYRASYYTPNAFRFLLGRCGWDGGAAEARSEPEGINHVMVARTAHSRSAVAAPSAMGTSAVSIWPVDGRALTGNSRMLPA
jgi:thymidylate kinase